MGDGIALQIRDCLNEMLELEEGGGLDRVNVTRGADDVSEETREIACVGDIVGNLVPRFNATNTKVSAGFRSASRVVSESGRDGWATAIVAADELLALSKAYGFTPRGLFRIGAAGENGERAIQLLGKHDAGEFVGEGHRAEREFLVPRWRR